jgi:hypothetical protein
MKTKWMLFLIGGVSAIAATVPLALSADLQPMVVATLAGDLRIEQGIPCADDVDQTTPVTQGRLELTPAHGVDVPAGKFFVVTRVNVSFAPFSIHRSCMGFSETRSYSELGVQLVKAVSFTAVSSGADVYEITIPKEEFLIYQAAMVNGQPEIGYKNPSEAVTGTIDLAHGTMKMRVVLATRIHFQKGCFLGGCLINEDKDGKLTATLDGIITFPDTDRDGVPDGVDNCRLFANADQGRVATPLVRPSDVTLASCVDSRIGAAVAVDLCDAGFVTVTNTAPATFAPGRNLVTWRGQDEKGRLGVATQTVTVVDTTPPIFSFVPPAIALNDCKAAILGVPIAIDDCAGTPTFTNNAPKIFGVGSTAVTWTASDVSRNQTTAAQIVTVTDTVSPAVSCAPAGRPAGAFRVASSDACTKSPAIRLGSFVLANGETIEIAETDQPGVKLVGVIGPNHIKRFEAGKGEALIAATDVSGNVASAYCR